MEIDTMVEKEIIEKYGRMTWESIKAMTQARDSVRKLMDEYEPTDPIYMMLDRVWRGYHTSIALIETRSP